MVTFKSIISDFTSSSLKEGDKTPKERIDNLHTSIEDLISILGNYNNIIFLSDKNKIAYDDLVTYVSDFEKIIKKHQEIIANNRTENIGNIEEEMNNLKFGNAANATAEINRIDKRISFNDFAEKIQSDWNAPKIISNETGKKIFDYGFINVNNKDFKEFIEYMKTYPNIEWGGIWTVKDIMHFQLNGNAQKDLEICDEYKKE